VVGANLVFVVRSGATMSGRRGDVLSAHDVSGLEALGTLGKVELDRLALVQAPVSVLLDRRKMYEHIFARGPLNEPIALGSVKPLDCTFLSHNLLLSHVIA
jgi:hypothetical protein